MSNTLTVMDAVNSFKGELIFSFEYLCYGKANNEYFAVEDLADINEDEYFICGKMKFKGLVKELETNFGRSYSYQQYKFVFKQMTSESKAKPVFTQAMADAKELPKVGMKCLINFPDIDNCWYEYIIDFIGKHTLIASCEDVEERFSHLDDVYIKPICTRTDKEKAVDDLFNADEHVANDINWHENFLQLIIDGQISNVKWVGK